MVLGNSFYFFMDDYEKDLLTIMMDERFVWLFGESALKDAGWRLSKDLISWCGQKEFSFSSGLSLSRVFKLLIDK